MTLVPRFHDVPAPNPIDLIEQIVGAQNWPFDRTGDDELNICVAGTWSDYYVSFNWQTDAQALQLAATFDFKTPAERRGEVALLLALINERLWLGHFDLASDNGAIVFRHGHLIAGASATPEQCETLMHLAVECVERYFPTFQFVVWAGKTAREAMDAAMLECQGQA